MSRAYAPPFFGYTFFLLPRDHIVLRRQKVKSFLSRNKMICPWTQNNGARWAFKREDSVSSVVSGTERDDNVAQLRIDAAWFLAELDSTFTFHCLFILAFPHGKQTLHFASKFWHVHGPFALERVFSESKHTFLFRFVPLFCYAMRNYDLSLIATNLADAYDSY